MNSSQNIQWWAFMAHRAESKEVKVNGKSRTETADRGRDQ